MERVEGGRNETQAAVPPCPLTPPGLGELGNLSQLGKLTVQSSLAVGEVYPLTVWMELDSEPLPVPQVSVAKGHLPSLIHSSIQTLHLRVANLSGGSSAPVDCRQEELLAVLIPYKNRKVSPNPISCRPEHSGEIAAKSDGAPSLPPPISTTPAAQLHHLRRRTGGQD